MSDTQDPSQPAPIVITKGSGAKPEKGFRTFLSNTRFIFGESVITWDDDGIADIVRHPEAMLFAPMMKMNKVTQANWPNDGAINGLSIVYGGRGAGKSEFLTRKIGADVTIRVGEPPELYDNLPGVLHFEGFLESFMRAVFLAKKGKKVAIDGARQLMFTKQGAALKGGLSSGVLAALTNMSIFCAEHGVHILLSVNPMVDEEDEAELFAKMTAACTGGWHLSQGDVVGETHRLISGRTFMAGSASMAPDVQPSDTGSLTGTAEGQIYGHSAFIASGQDALSNLKAFGGIDSSSATDPEDDLKPRKGSRIVFAGDKE